MASVDLIAAVDALTSIVTDGLTAPLASDFGIAWAAGFVLPLAVGIVASVVRSLLDMLRD